MADNSSESKGLPALVAPAAMVARIKSEIDLEDRAHLVEFGAGAQRDVTDFAERVLRQTKNKELGDTGALLSEVLAKARGLDPASLEKAGFFERMLSSLEQRVQRFRDRFEEVAGQIETVCLQLETRKEVLRRDIAMLDELHGETEQSVVALSAYIDAGKQFADEVEKAELPKLQANIETAKKEGRDGLLEAQAYQDAVQALDRLRKRVFYLQQARQIGIQQLPQIRVVQAGDETLIENLQASISLTIPAWKQKMILLLGLTRQKDALKLQAAVTEATDEMMRQASEMLKTQAIDIEKQAQQGLVSMETLAQVNQDLIDTIGSVVKVQEEGRAKRAEAEQQMEGMTTALRTALAESGYGR